MPPVDDWAVRRVEIEVGLVGRVAFDQQIQTWEMDRSVPFKRCLKTGTGSVKPFCCPVASMLPSVSYSPIICGFIKAQCVTYLFVPLKCYAGEKTPFVSTCPIHRFTDAFSYFIMGGSKRSWLSDLGVCLICEAWRKNRNTMRVFWFVCLFVFFVEYTYKHAGLMWNVVVYTKIFKFKSSKKCFALNVCSLSASTPLFLTLVVPTWADPGLALWLQRSSPVLVWSWSWTPARSVPDLTHYQLMVGNQITVIQFIYDITFLA